MTSLGQGGSIPLCNVFAETYPEAELILMGVEEPLALIHAPNESVDPTEIANMALSRPSSSSATPATPRDPTVVGAPQRRRIQKTQIDSVESPHRTRMRITTKATEAIGFTIPGSAR